MQTYKWLKFPLINETKFRDKIEEMFVAGVNMRFLHITADMFLNTITHYVVLMYTNITSYVKQ